MTLAARMLYNILLPVFCLIAGPGWILRMARRGGLGPRLWERLGCYDRPPEFESSGGVYVHAVSVGEVMMALKLIDAWRRHDPEEQFVLAATTSTGFQLAEAKVPEGVRVIYSPVDFPILIGRLIRRFEPRLIVLVDSELWPNLLFAAERRQIPVALINARLSPRSARRYARFKAVTGPMLGRLKLVCAQAGEHAELWREIGVRRDAVEVTGSVKFDADETGAGTKREEFAAMLKAFGGGRPIVLGASTHAGEEAMVARAVRTVPGALAVVLPRHAERRHEVKRDLEQAGFEVVLRSGFRKPEEASGAVFVVDSTGELRDWTAHADVVVIGKSLLGMGGQNPAEAIEAKVPVVCGRSMGNFEPLISQLRAAEAVRTVDDETALGEAIGDVLGHARLRTEMIRDADRILRTHNGATARTLVLLLGLAPR